MPHRNPPPSETLALSTKLEEDFVSPLTSVRGALEILRDFPDLEHDKRQEFIARALKDCAVLQRGIEELGNVVYTSGRRAESAGETKTKPQADYADRIHTFEDDDIIEIDFSDFEFNNHFLVDEFFDKIQYILDKSNKKWYFLVNHTRCSVWPETWIAFAHRGRMLSDKFSLGLVKYSVPLESNTREGVESKSPAANSSFLTSREAALMKIKEMKGF